MGVCDNQLSVIRKSRLGEVWEVERLQKKSRQAGVATHVYADVSAVMGVALGILLRCFRSFFLNAYFCVVWLTVCLSFIALFSLAMCQLAECTVQEVCSLMKKPN